MTLLQMSYILEVDRCGSMNRAARNLFLSQSALSAAIAEVERELGAPIFDRSSSPMRLTAAGQEYVHAGAEFDETHMFVDIAVFSCFGVCHDTACHGSCYLACHDFYAFRSFYDYRGTFVVGTRFG